jgi:hypothetical protein
VVRHARQRERPRARDRADHGHSRVGEAKGKAEEAEGNAGDRNGRGARSPRPERDEAIQALEAQGLKADVNEVPSDRPKDTVVSQHPAGGTKVDENSLQSPGGGAQAKRGDHVLFGVSMGERPTRR